MENKLNVFDENGVPLTLTEVLDRVAQSPFIFLPKLTRIEVIDRTGTSYHNWKPHNKIQMAIQDEGRTIKLFVAR